MEMFFLVIKLWSAGTVVMPREYTKEECDAAGKKANDYLCVPIPKQIATPSIIKPEIPNGSYHLYDKDQSRYRFCTSDNFGKVTCE